MRVCVVSGSRADAGLLQPVINALKADPYFDLDVKRLPGLTFSAAAGIKLIDTDLLVILGDRYEILAVAITAHLNRIPIAHICGGDVSLGSYDDAMRDCISRMATLHFTTSMQSTARLIGMGYKNVHLVGSPGIDTIIAGEWKKERPVKERYVVVAYQAETIDGTVDLDAVKRAIGGRKAIWTMPNPDRGNERLPQGKSYPHEEFLNLLFHADEFIGNSSAIFYEAPFLGVKTTLIGKRQDGRVMPWGDGHASEKIRDIIVEWHNSEKS